jgi:hypothetical protein
MFCCPLVPPGPFGKAEDDLIEVGVGREVLHHDAALIVADGEAGLQPQDGRVPGGQGGQVAGDGTTGQEVRRADERCDAFARCVRLPDDVPEGIDDPSRAERRPAALAMSIAVDQPDGNRWQLRPLGCEGNDDTSSAASTPAASSTGG